jgi:hypothetical protein
MLQVDSPTPDARRFLDLHRHHLVTSWQWCFGETMLRACTDRECATIRRTDLDELIHAGLMERGVGFAMRVVDKPELRSKVAE